MWDKLKKYLSYAWASPVTLFALIYVGAFTALGWYSWYKVEGDALVWLVNNEKIPGWLADYWRRWGGHASGQVIVLKRLPDEKAFVLKHEQKHVDQFLKLGVFWPVVYYGSSLAIKIGCTGSDPYYDNPFEIDARRHAGQVVDVIGMRKRLIDNSKKKTS